MNFSKVLAKGGGRVCCCCCFFFFLFLFLSPIHFGQDTFRQRTKNRGQPEVVTPFSFYRTKHLWVMLSLKSSCCSASPLPSHTVLQYEDDDRYKNAWRQTATEYGATCFFPNQHTTCVTERLIWGWLLALQRNNYYQASALMFLHNSSSTCTG